MKSERGEISVCAFECCMLDEKKSWVEISLEKWNAFETDEFSSETLDRTFKEMVHFVHEMHPVFVVILSTFAHMLCGSNDDTMPSFNLFWVQFVALSNFKVI